MEEEPAEEEEEEEEEEENEREGCENGGGRLPSWEGGGSEGMGGMSGWLAMFIEGGRVRWGW